MTYSETSRMQTGADKPAGLPAYTEITDDNANIDIYHEFTADITPAEQFDLNISPKTALGHLINILRSGKMELLAEYSSPELEAAIAEFVRTVTVEQVMAFDPEALDHAGRLKKLKYRDPQPIDSYGVDAWDTAEQWLTAHASRALRHRAPKNEQGQTPAVIAVDMYPAF